MNKKLALFGFSLISVATLAVLLAGFNNDNMVALNAEGPTPSTRTITFNDFADNTMNLYNGGDDYWTLNPETGNYLGLNGNNIRSATNTSITLNGNNGYLKNATVAESAGQRKYKIGLIDAFTVYYDGSGLQYDTGGNKYAVISGTEVQFIFSPASNLTLTNTNNVPITITSIVFKYKC